MWIRTAVVVALAVSAPAQERVGIGRVAEIARARAERQRPELERTLQPFLADLRLDHEPNRAVVDAAIEKVAALGDSMVPLLLELLTPDTGRREELNLAENAARVLAQLETAAFVDTLVELADGDHPVGRRQAIWLLARSDRPVALAALIRNFPRLTEPRAVQAALQAVAQSGSPALRELAAPQLMSSDAGVRGAVLDYLGSIGDAGPLERVLESLAGEQKEQLYGHYVRYLQAAAPANAEAARALLALLESGRLDAPTRLEVVHALRVVAPEDDRETRDALRTILEAGETREVGVAIVQVLEHMGDRRARDILFATLAAKLNERRNNVNLLQDRAYAWFAFGQYPRAIDDYKRAIDFSSSRARTSVFFLKIARCFAHMNRSGSMLEAIEDAGVTLEEVEREAAEDPVFAEALSNSRIRARLESIVRR